MRTPEEVQRDREQLLDELAVSGTAVDADELTCRIYGIRGLTPQAWEYAGGVLADLKAMAAAGLVKRVGSGNGAGTWTLTPAVPAPRVATPDRGDLVAAR